MAIQIEDLENFLKVVQIIKRNRGIEGAYEWICVSLSVPLTFGVPKNDDELVKFAKYVYTFNFDLDNFRIKDVAYIV